MQYIGVLEFCTRSGRDQCYGVPFRESRCAMGSCFAFEKYNLTCGVGFAALDSIEGFWHSSLTLADALPAFPEFGYFRDWVLALCDGHRSNLIADLLVAGPQDVFDPELLRSDCTCGTSIVPLLQYACLSFSSGHW